MPITVSGTSITFNDSTTQTTAFTGGGGVTSLNGQTGAITNTSVNTVGSVMLLAVYAGLYTSYYSGQTIAGTSLYYSSAISQYNNVGLAFNGTITGAGTNQYTAPVGSGAFGQLVQRNVAGNTGRVAPAGMTACTGTWRLMSPVGAGGASGFNACCNITFNYYYVSLWARVS